MAGWYKRLVQKIRLLRKKKHSGQSDKTDHMQHIIRDIPAVAPTCTEKGLTAGKYCVTCKQFVAAPEEVDALGHSIVVDPAVPATCIDDGRTEGRHCSVCGEVLVPQTVIKAVGHHPTTIDGIPATCTAPGKTAAIRCDICGTVIEEAKVISPLGHTIVVDPAVPATCTAPGLTEGSHCSTCGAVIVPQQQIPAIGHVIVTDPAVPSTYTEEGLTEGQHCAVCGEVIIPQERTPVLKQTASLPAVETEEKSTAVPEAKEHQKRILTLSSSRHGLWPLGRILAFGATKEDYQNLKELYYLTAAPAFSDAVSYFQMEKYNRWVDTLNNEEWKQALSLCEDIAAIRSNNKLGMAAALHMSMGLSEEEAAQLLNLRRIDLRQEYNAYVRAVTDLFRHHMSALSFLYPNQFFDKDAAKIFFGSVSYKRIEHCCDLEKIHEFRNKISEKPVALRATLKEEASNKRTIVLDDWAHLKRYLEEQFDSQPLLGNIELNDKEYDLLLNYLKAFMNHPTRNDKMVCVALVQIAVRCPGTAFWPEVAAAIGLSSVTSDMMSNLGKCFLYTMKLNKKATYTKTEYVASIKLHTFVTNAGIPRFFDFLFAYYDMDLGRNMELADLSELQALMISGNYFSRKQLILQQTLDALRLAPEVGLQRLKTYLSWINEAYWTPGWKPENEDRFGRSFVQWCSQNDEFNGKWGISDSVRRRGKRMYSQPVIEMDIKTGNMYLILPVQKLPFDCADIAIWHMSFDPGAEILCEITESITSCHTDEKRILLPYDKLLDEIQTSFANGNEVLRKYTINSDCVRIFNENGRMMTGASLAEGMTYFFMSPDAPIKTNQIGTEQMVGPWLVKSLVLKTGDTILFPDQTLGIVGGDLAEGLCGLAPAGNAVVKDQDDNSYNVYAQLPRILLKVSEEQFSLTRIQVNNDFYPAPELKHTHIILNERTNDKGYMISLPYEAEPFKLYRVHAAVPNDNHNRKWQFCYWEKFDCRFMSSKNGLPYWDTPKGSLMLNKEAVVESKALEKDPFANEFGFEISPDIPVLDLSISGTNCKLLLEVPACFWKSNDIAWGCHPLGSIWYNELPDSIVFMTKMDEITFYVDSDGLNEDHWARYYRNKDSGQILCDLLPLRQWLTRDKIMHKVYMQIGDATYEFASVYCKSYFVSGWIEADYQNDTLHGTFDIVGHSSYSVSIFRNNEELLHQIPLENGEFTVQTTLDSGNYTAVIYESIEDEFGFETIYDEIGREQTRIINPLDLTGSTIYLKQLDTFCGNSANLPLPDKYYKILVCHKSGSHPACYTGRMSIRDGSVKDLPVQIILPDSKIQSHCAVLFEDEGEYQSFLYDYVTKRLALTELPHLHRMERYRRYSVLDPDDQFTVVFEAN